MSPLQFALFEIKIGLLESGQKCLRHRSSTKPLLSLCIHKKKHFDKNNDVMHNIFRCLIQLIWMILL